MLDLLGLAPDPPGRSCRLSIPSDSVYRRLIVPQEDHGDERGEEGGLNASSGGRPAARHRGEVDLEGALNALSASPDGSMIIAAGRDVLKVRPRRAWVRV